MRVLFRSLVMIFYPWKSLWSLDLWFLTPEKPFIAVIEGFRPLSARFGFHRCYLTPMCPVLVSGSDFWLVRGPFWSTVLIFGFRNLSLVSNDDFWTPRVSFYSFWVTFGSSKSLFHSCMAFCVPRSHFPTQKQSFVQKTLSIAPQAFF